MLSSRRRATCFYAHLACEDALLSTIYHKLPGLRCENETIALTQP